MILIIFYKVQSCFSTVLIFYFCLTVIFLSFKCLAQTFVAFQSVFTLDLDRVIILSVMKLIMGNWQKKSRG